MLGILVQVLNDEKTLICLAKPFSVKDLLTFQDHHTVRGDVISIPLFLLTLCALKPLYT